MKNEGVFTNEEHLYQQKERNRMLNKLVIGSIGPAYKTVSFREKEFNKKLAPTSAKLEHIQIDGQKFIVMTYRV